MCLCTYNEPKCFICTVVFQYLRLFKVKTAVTAVSWCVVPQLVRFSRFFLNVKSALKAKAQTQNFYKR